jgi:hypothetical protein
MRIIFLLFTGFSLVFLPLISSLLPLIPSNQPLQYISPTATMEYLLETVGATLTEATIPENFNDAIG